jgi:hypothetical protein
LIQDDGHEIIGTVALNPIDSTLMTVNWDQDTYPTNSPLTSYNGYTSVRTSSPGTFDAIIDPQVKGPRGSGLADPVAGTRYLIIEDLGNSINGDGPDAWKADNGDDFTAKANDIIEWSGSAWHVIFEASINQFLDRPIYQTNTYSTGLGIQYKWDGELWSKSFEGEYRAGSWILEL